MKNVIKLSLLAVLLLSSVAVYADGNMTTGNKTCTVNCTAAIGDESGDSTPANANEDRDSTDLVDTFFALIERLVEVVA